MKKLFESILIVIATFFVLLLLNTVINYLMRDFGSVNIGKVIDIKSQLYLPLDIYNYSKKPINGLQMFVPSTTSIQDIVSSSPLRIEEISTTGGLGDTKKIILSDIDPVSVAQLMIPIENGKQNNLISIINSEDLRLSIVTRAEIQNPILKAMYGFLGYSIIASIYCAILLFIFTRIYESNSKKMIEKIDSIKEDAKKIEKSYFEYRDAYLKIRVYLSARISEYQKELDFWRDTIRKVIYEETKNKNDAEKLIDQVSLALKTYSLRENSTLDLDFMLKVSDMLATYKKGETST
jgi:hypothetical protein